MIVARLNDLTKLQLAEFSSGRMAVSILILTIASCMLTAQAARSPILLIPGFTASQLETRVTSAQSNCECCTDWTGLWINVTRASTLTDCFLNELTLIYNPATNEYTNPQGVEVRAPGFGITRTVADLASGASDDDTTATFPYMNELIDFFVNRGYVSGSTIRAAPYDWRLSAVQLEQRGYYSQVQSLVETMYNESNNERVTIVVHSMGGLVSLYFLNDVVSQEWKDKYIHAYIPIGAPFGGTASAFGAVVIGADSINGLAGGRNTAEVSRSFAGISMLLPRPSVYNDTVIISTPDLNYTASDYQDIFDDVGYPDGYQMYLGTEDINAGYRAPNVTVHCVVGTGVPTPVRLAYSTGNISNISGIQIVNGMGDGTVEARGTEVCLRWQNMEQNNFTYQAVPNVNHEGLLSNTDVLEAILSITITSQPPIFPPLDIDIGAIVGGVIAALLIICALIIIIPLLICCCCGVGIGAVCGCVCCQVKKAVKSDPV